MSGVSCNMTASVAGRIHLANWELSELTTLLCF
jgi:hypothetical protein